DTCRCAAPTSDRRAPVGLPEDSARWSPTGACPSRRSTGSHTASRVSGWLPRSQPPFCGRPCRHPLISRVVTSIDATDSEHLKPRQIEECPRTGAKWEQRNGGDTEASLGNA